MNQSDLQAFARAAFRRAEAISPPAPNGAPSVVLLGSGIATLRPNCSVMLCGIRPGGGIEDAEAEAEFARGLYSPSSDQSSILDIAWHGSARGASSHQIAIQAVLAFLNGCPIGDIEPWLAGDRRPPEERLRHTDLTFVRETPQVHLSPFRARLVEAGFAAPAQFEQMGLWVVQKTRPKLLVTDGNGDSSAFATVVAQYPVEEVWIEDGIPRSHNIKRTRVTGGELAGMEVLGLPTLSRAKKSNVMRILEVLDAWKSHAPDSPVGP